MKKIPTIFLRDENDPKYVTRTWHPDALWVRDGEGTPTQKYDGTCVMFDGSNWWARRTVSPGKQAPTAFRQEDFDEITKKAVGWEPIAQSAFRKPHAEAIAGGVFLPGTYELCGPKINGNPEQYPVHVLIRHDEADVLIAIPRDYQTLRKFCLNLLERGVEGIVFHRTPGDPNTQMAKLKGRDFRMDN